VIVTETFFALTVADMHRATAFYVDVFGATVMFATPAWTSLQIAGVRVGLAHSPEHHAGHTGLHFVVADLAAVSVAIARHGCTVGPPTEVAPGVVIALATDPEGNGFTLRAA
jgi:predicted enzyme related to lactoylglutathione lyase